METDWQYGAYSNPSGVEAVVFEGGRWSEPNSAWEEESPRVQLGDKDGWAKTRLR